MGVKKQLYSKLRSGQVRQAAVTPLIITPAAAPNLLPTMSGQGGAHAASASGQRSISSREI